MYKIRLNLLDLNESLRMEEIIQALQLKAELDALRPIDKEQEGRIMQKFRLDWNYHSNHLEGNSLTYGETKALILFGVTAQGKPLKDTLEITGHNEAINWVLDMIQGERPLTENFIRELHSLLLQDSYRESKNAKGEIVPRKISSGKYKTTPNHVETATGEIFYFATPEETPAKMFDLINWYNEKTNEKEPNPILIAAEFHYKFIRIHPFDDGNGRTARILMNFILMQFGFPPVTIKTEDKTNYFAALQFADAGNIEAFITYIAQNLNRSLAIMIAGAKGEEIEEDDDLDKEIKLLEQRLLNVGKIIETEKTNDSIINFLNGSFKIMLNSLIDKLEKFEKYYLNKGIFIVLNNKSIIYHRNENFITSRNIEIARDFKVVINYNTLKFNNFEYFRFYCEIEIVFEQLFFTLSIHPVNAKNINYTKGYKEQLTDKEISSIIKYVIGNHNQLLEKEISEKGSKP